MHRLVVTALFASLVVAAPLLAADTPPSTPPAAASSESQAQDPAACGCAEGKGRKCCNPAAAAVPPQDGSATAAPHAGCGCGKKKAGS